MVLKEICQILGKTLRIFSLLLSCPLGMALYDEWLAPPSLRPSHSMAFVYAIACCLALSLLFLILGRKAKGQIGRRESILLVSLIWIFTSLLSALPFYFSGTLSNPMDAYFEAMSGLTTTGSTMMSPKAYDPSTGEEIPIYITSRNAPSYTYAYYGTIPPIRDPNTHLVIYSGVEAVSRAILFWRSFMQWVGGMGIVVLFLTVLPALGVGGKLLYQMETTGPFKEAIRPRIHETVSELWKLYLFLTLLQIILLICVDREMPLFDAICTACSTISTGGFSIRNDSIASYHNSGVEWIIMIFMILGSINFSLYFHIIRMKIYRIYVPDFILFLAIVLIGSLLSSLFLIGEPRTTLDEPMGIYSIGQAFQEGTFQTISLQTTTGFVTANYDRWPFFVQMLLLLLMFVGGMSGSTAGGIKTSRFYILYKIILHRLESLYRPDSIRKLRIGLVDVDDKQALTVAAFFCIAAFFTIFGTSLFIWNQMDPQTAFGFMASCINNVGAAFGAAGPTASLGFLSNFDKFLATCWMLLGRLEFYVLLLLFLPSYWKSH